MAEGLTICLTGATGYIGSRLATHLLEAGHHLRCMTRSKLKLASRPWSNHAHVEIYEADGEDEQRLAEMLTGCDVAYYLIHSMVVAGEKYASKDKQLAKKFAQAASKAGVKRIIYLGGLGEMGENLSRHLSSRREVEYALASTEVPVTVLRAAMIIGSGSASFEILRYLVERLPIMLTPQWVWTRNQPIAVRNVLHYLKACLEVEETTGKTLDIGGPDVLRYVDIIHIMAAQLGLARRRVIPIPFLSPKVSAYWIHVLSPAPARLARPLAEGLRNEVICRDDEAARLMPQDLFTVEKAIQVALEKRMKGLVDSSWADAGLLPGDPDWTGKHKRMDRRTIWVDAHPAAVFDAVCNIGGENGWYGADWLWHIRGVMDKVIGGPGLQRGRRNKTGELAYGDPLDFWRVMDIQDKERLLLQAEMKLPGHAFLEFQVKPEDQGTRLVQTAHFYPDGLAGLAYWYSVVPLHYFVFAGMIKGIARSAMPS